MKTKTIPIVTAIGRTCLILLTTLAVAHVGKGASYVWSGAGPGLLWQTGSNWNPSGPPGAEDAALFWDAGATNGQGSFLANNVVSADRVVASLMFGQTNGYHNTFLNPGVTLTVSNNGTGNVILTGTGTDNGNATIVTATISGLGAFFEVIATNPGSLFNVRQGTTSSGGSKRATLNLSELDTFSLTAGRLLVAGDGNSTAAQNRPNGTLIMARTNLIRLNGAAPAINVGDGSSNGGTEFVELGQTNAIFADSMTIARQKCTATLNFGMQYWGASLYLRGNSTNRMAAMAIGDNSAQSTSGVASSGTVDLSTGIVDAQVGTCYVGRGQNGTGNGRATGVLKLGSGIFDVNTLEVAYVNIGTAAATVTGTVDVNAGGTLVVNDSLRLGRNPGATALAQATLNVLGGELRASAITSSAGGVDASLNLNSASFVLTNTAGAPDAPITTLTTADTRLKLHIDTGRTNLCVLTLNTFGSSTNNTIDVLSLPVITGYPAQFPLISYQSYAPGLADFALGQTPAGSPAYTGYISNNVTTSTLDLVITGGPAPAQLITWNGNINGDWDTATANWRAAGGPASFRNNDLVTLDDSASGTTTVTLKTIVLPSSLVVSNETKAYQLSGTGGIGGAFALEKAGAAALVLANSGENTFSGGVQLLEGTLQIGVSDDRLPTNAVVSIADAANTALDLNNLNQTVASVTGGGSSGGNILLGSGTLTITAGGGDHRGIISGAGSVVKSVAGTQVLGGANLYSGGTIVSGGRLNLANTTGSGTGSGFVRVETNSVLALGAGAEGGSVAASMITNHGTVVFDRTDDFTLVNTITGDGAVTKANINMLLVPISNSHTGITTVAAGALRVSHPGALGTTDGPTSIQNNPTARLELTGGLTWFEPIVLSQKQSAAGQVPGILNVSGSNTLAGNIDATAGGSYWILQVDDGKLTLTGNITNINTSGNRSFRLLGVGTGEIQGPIYRVEGSTSPTAVWKEQSGTWIMSGPAHLPGPSVISEGTLQVDGLIYGGGTVAVNGGILSGTGQIDNAVTVNGGTLAPGKSIGTLTVSNNLTLGGMTIMEVSSTSNDQVRGINSLTMGGVLQVVVLGNLNGGEVFKLFQASSYAGDFAYDLPVLPSPLAWDYSGVPIDGTLRVTGGAAPKPTIAPVTVSNGSLVLDITTFPGYSYVLQSTTNVGPAAFWVNESTNAGTGSNLILNVPIETAKPQKFLRFWVY